MLGKNRTAHTVARDSGHEDVFQFLLAHTPEDLKLALACELGDETIFRSVLATTSGSGEVPLGGHAAKLPNAAQSNNTKAVRLMLAGGMAGGLTR